ncbi:hypothetical protein EK904_003207 [Melospiza melodia maxima]|nr:hypothetical protein EK904_003207 [Melospiza melodia maxima]
MLSWTDSRTEHSLITSTTLDIMDYLNNGTLPSGRSAWAQLKSSCSSALMSWGLGDSERDMISQMTWRKGEEAEYIVVKLLGIKEEQGYCRNIHFYLA